METNTNDLDQLLEKFSRSNTVRDKNIKSNRNLQDLINFGYVELTKDGSGLEYRITPSGMKFYQTGGFKGFDNRCKVEQEDINWRIKLNKWYYRYKWLPPTLSIISIVISVAAIIIVALCK
jgi:hypothetical protein